jgi:hypothetical protein
MTQTIAIAQLLKESELTGVTISPQQQDTVDMEEGDMDFSNMQGNLQREPGSLVIGEGTMITSQRDMNMVTINIPQRPLRQR